MKHSFSLFADKNKKNNSNVLRSFIQQRILSQKEVDEGHIWANNYPYRIIFDQPSPDGILIIENLPCKVICSFRTLIAGESVVVVRLYKPSYIRNAEKQEREKQCAN